MKWPVVRLGDKVTIRGGGTPSRLRADFYQGDIPWATIKDLTGLYLEYTQEHITEEALESSAANLIPAGNVILATRVGLGKVATNTIDVAINQDLKALFCSPRLDPKYLVYYLTSLSDSIEKQGVGATVKGVTLKQVENWPLPFPTLSEQRRIVEVLDQADALRKKRAEADAKAERILHALFVKMFGDPVTNPKGWPKTRLGDVIVETQYGTSTRANTDGEGVTVLRMNNIDSSGRLDLRDLKYVALNAEEVEKYALEPGDILFNRTNSKELVGKTGLWKGEIEAILASYLIRVRIDRRRVLPEYVWAHMNTSFMKQVLFDKARQAIGMANINAQELRSLPIIIPDLQLQRSFARSLEGLGGLMSLYSRAENQIERLFHVLLHRAFFGDLTAKWREAHMKELLAEMDEQAKYLTAQSTNDHRETVALQGSLFGGEAPR